MTETKKKQRTYKPEAEAFTDFDECFIAWSDNAGGRRVYQGKNDRGEDVYILAGTQLQAIKKWYFDFAIHVRKLDKDQLHRTLAERNVERHEEHLITLSRGVLISEK